MCEFQWCAGHQRRASPVLWGRVTCVARLPSTQPCPLGCFGNLKIPVNVGTKAREEVTSTGPAVTTAHWSREEHWGGPWGLRGLGPHALPAPGILTMRAGHLASGVSDPGWAGLCSSPSSPGPTLGHLVIPGSVPAGCHVVIPDLGQVAQLGTAQPSLALPSLALSSQLRVAWRGHLLAVWPQEAMSPF